MIGRWKQSTVLACGGMPDHIGQPPVLATGTRPTSMPIRMRKLIGAIALLLLLTIWVLLGMAFAQLPLFSENRMLAGVYYVAVGLGWVLPAMPLVRWMARTDRPPGK